MKLNDTAFFVVATVVGCVAVFFVALMPLPLIWISGDDMDQAGFERELAECGRLREYENRQTSEQITRARKAEAEVKRLKKVEEVLLRAQKGCDAEIASLRQRIAELKE